jgi:hypothetical protein
MIELKLSKSGVLKNARKKITKKGFPEAAQLFTILLSV